MPKHGIFYQLAFHFIWGTKDRLPLITPEVEARLYPYLGAKCKQLDYHLYALNGIADHIHILLGLHPTTLLADVVKNIKGASSHYINKQSGLNATLYWQDGYGLLSLRQAEVPRVAAYIKRQKEHHLRGTISTLLERIES
ncbi:MAG: IS200/IS605 family transposase [Chloroflexi bacterium]|nr:IS200/IS605 family transposase [Chloroflexota bacterium]MBI3733607.1 IS200/IS605 family transposase [Chloroflexota bacterium]